AIPVWEVMSSEILLQACERRGARILNRLDKMRVRLRRQHPATIYNARRFWQQRDDSSRPRSQALNIDDRHRMTGSFKRHCLILEHLIGRPRIQFTAGEYKVHSELTTERGTVRMRLYLATESARSAAIACKRNFGCL